jgi:formylglycine-generating enzyme required for sulfatase activity
MLVVVPVAQWLWSRAVELRSLAARVDALPVAAATAPADANLLDAISARLRQHRRTLDEVRAIAPQAASLSEGRREHIEQAERATRADLADMRRELLGQIGQNLQAGVAAAAGTDEAELSHQAALLAGVYELEGSAQPDAQLVELLLPRITLTTEPPGATVFARRLDASTGVVVDTAWADLGTSDLVDLPVVPGYYRFIAVAPDGRYGEITQLVADSGLTSVLPRLVLRPADDVAIGMLRIEAGDYATSTADRLHRDWPGALQLHEHEPVGAFLVDRDEVTNAQFAAFCAANGLTQPLPPDGPDASWDARPVAFVDVYQAEAYAAWSGKRLLVKCEWRRAAEGEGGRRFPWGNEPADLDAVQQRANVHNRPVLPSPAGPVAPRTSEDDWPMYLLGTQPVGSFPAGATPEGVRDLLGNVSEWTATIFMNKVGRDVWRPESGTHVVLGLSFWENPNVFDTDALVHSPAVSFDIGFRCARTAPEELPHDH